MKQRVLKMKNKHKGMALTVMGFGKYNPKYATFTRRFLMDAYPELKSGSWVYCSCMNTFTEVIK